jgi:predicted amidohydrolase
MSILPREGSLERFGFFHCEAKLEENPIDELTKAIEKERPEVLRNSLIVLPEAFNLVGDYHGSSHGIGAAREILEGLRMLAVRLQIAFVAGVLEGRTNSAYWIDGDGKELMCRKIGDDRTRLYDPCLDNPDGCNPISCANAHVGALICMDACVDRDENAPHVQRRNDLLKRLNEVKGTRIVCVPARFSESCGTLTFLEEIQDGYVVVANGYVGGASFVFHRSGATIDRENDEIWAQPRDVKKVKLMALRKIEPLE